MDLIKHLFGFCFCFFEISIHVNLNKNGRFYCSHHILWHLTSIWFGEEKEPPGLQREKGGEVKVLIPYQSSIFISTEGDKRIRMIKLTSIQIHLLGKARFSSILGIDFSLFLVTIILSYCLPHPLPGAKQDGLKNMYFLSGTN